MSSKVQVQIGGGACSLCGAQGTNKSTCPFNKDAKTTAPGKHNATRVSDSPGAKPKRKTMVKDNSGDKLVKFTKYVIFSVLDMKTDQRELVTPDNAKPMLAKLKKILKVLENDKFANREFWDEPVQNINVTLKSEEFRKSHAMPTLEYAKAHKIHKDRSLRKAFNKKEITATELKKGLAEHAKILRETTTYLTKAAIFEISWYAESFNGRFAIDNDMPYGNTIKAVNSGLHDGRHEVEKAQKHALEIFNIGQNKLLTISNEFMYMLNAEKAKQSIEMLQNITDEDLL